LLAQPKLHHIVATTITANTLAWYEFALYLSFTPLFAKLFFPPEMGSASIINTLFIFALGFLSRPLGTLFFSHIGDRLGRKVALLLSILFLTLPTFIIGFIPTYAQIGLAAPILIALMRLLQSFPVGGEFAGTMCYFFEISPKHRRGLLGSFTFFGSQVGLTLSIVEFLLLEKFLSPEAFMSWGWRVSFIFGSLTGFTGWYLRHKLIETPLFETIKTEGKLSPRPILESLKEYKLPIFKAFLLSALPLGGWYVLFIFFPLYFSEILGTSLNEQLLLNAGLLLLSTLFLPLFGHLADRSHKKSLLLGSGVAIFLLAYPLYTWVIHYSFTLFVILQLTMNLLLTAQYALLPLVLCELFPIRVRYSCVGMGYNFCNLLFGGSTPAIALSLSTKTGNLMGPTFFMMLMALLSLSPLLSLKKQKNI